MRFNINIMKTKFSFLTLVFTFLLLSVGSLQTVVAQTSTDWPMAGANPQRTSWTPENIGFSIATKWVKPIAPYISQHVQVIGAEGKVFVSTSKGLYAFDATTGADSWVYPNELPFGHSPTYANGFLYVGGMDKKIHKVSASNGQGVWTFTGDGGFDSSPIVANGKVYATSRDGALYAINDEGGSASLAWKFQTGNMILQSPAFKDNALYFASNDGYAYAVDATSGSQIWQSDSNPQTPENDKFPSMGFYAWWPVIYGDDVIFMNSGFYSTSGAEAKWLFCPVGTNCSSIPAGVVPGTLGNEPGNWVTGEKTADLRTNPYGGTFMDYFETYPYHRNAYFINRTTGKERQFDLDSDGITDAAPISWVGDAGSHDVPVVVGNATATDSDDVLYFHTVNRSKILSWSNANISGWKVGTPFISLPSSSDRSSDEPMGISAAGGKIYYNHCCDRGVGVVDITIPNSTFPTNNKNKEKGYISSGGLPFFTWAQASGSTGIPANSTNHFFKEAAKFFWDPKVLPNEPTLPCCAAVFWNENDKVGPSAYQGNLYVVLGNALVAIGAGGTGTTAPVLASAPFVTAPVVEPTLTDEQLKSRLEQEVSEIITAGHLKPSYLGAGFVTGYITKPFVDNLDQYWHNPADVQMALLRALPFLSTGLQSQVSTYLQNEMANFSPATFSHIGWTNGGQRDPYPYPPSNSELLFNVNFGPIQASASNFNAWSLPPTNVYALWKYAQAGLGDASALLTQLGTGLKTPITANKAILTDGYLGAFPNIHNAYIAGYKGYVELAKLAGQQPAQYEPFETELNRLLTLRVENLKTFPNTQQSFGICDNECYFESLITYLNFAYMTPELGEYLRTNTSSAEPDKNVLTILQKYQDIAPFWMQTHNGETQGESAIEPYHQTHSLFQALAQVKDAPREELAKYLDSPIVPVGDLYFIENLTAVLEASDAPPPPVYIGDANADTIVDQVDYGVWLGNYNTTTTEGSVVGDFNHDSKVDGIDYVIWLTTLTN